MTLVSDHVDTPDPTLSHPAGKRIMAGRVWEIIKAIDIAMLVTRWPDGLRGCPISTIPTQEQGLVKDLSNPSAQRFRPEGPEAHAVSVLKIDPGHADVWDGPGLLGGIASTVSAAVKGQWQDLGDRGEVDL